MKLCALNAQNFAFFLSNTTIRPTFAMLWSFGNPKGYSPVQW